MQFMAPTVCMWLDDGEKRSSASRLEPGNLVAVKIVNQIRFRQPGRLARIALDRMLAVS